ncbi:hypothetical protein SRB521_00306 [Intestinimonas butyriciproducens]|nr:hypothetical protein SRB521_00306 [Intestinimonas butyriciproducens]
MEAGRKGPAGALRRLWPCCWAGTACTRGMPAVFSMDCCPFSLGEPQSGVS